MSDIREMLGLMIAYYQSDGYMNERLSARREAQTISCAEVLRLLDGDTRMLHQLRAMGLVPFMLSDLPERLGGVEAT